MLLSMTGHGQAHRHAAEVAIHVEVRSVNNRFLKVVSKLSDRIASLEGAVEGVVRELVRRGTVHVSIRISSESSSSDYRLNPAVIVGYARQAQAIAEDLQWKAPLAISDLLHLPGVVIESLDRRDDDALIENTMQTLRLALASLNEMRRQEGQAMQTDLLANLAHLREIAHLIAERAPLVVEEYRSRLHSRIEKSLEKLGVELQPADILRELQIFADRCDIREELVRLQSHFQLFQQCCQETESQGRKLDFLVQELGREVNTVGSKANDAAITEHVVTMKTIVEQLREIVQNIE